MNEKDLGYQIQDVIRIQQILKLSLKEVCNSYGQILDYSYQDEAKRVRSAMNRNRRVIKRLVGKNEWQKKEYQRQTSDRKWWW